MIGRMWMCLLSMVCLLSFITWSAFLLAFSGDGCTPVKAEECTVLYSVLWGKRTVSVGKTEKQKDRQTDRQTEMTTS